MSNNEAPRPLLVTIIGALYFVCGIFALLLGIISIIGISILSDSGLFAVIGGIGLIGAVIYIVIGYGLLKGWKVMWYLGVIFSIIGLILGIISLPYGIISLIINALIIYYLFRPKVKEFFGI